MEKGSEVSGLEKGGFEIGKVTEGAFAGPRHPELFHEGRERRRIGNPARNGFGFLLSLFGGVVVGDGDREVVGEGTWCGVVVIADRKVGVVVRRK
jgi:hypothetical protein